MEFTIVTPCLNAQAHIAETIESVMRQKGAFSIQHLIMDGGSTDETEQIVRHWQERLSVETKLIGCEGATLEWVSQPDDSMYQAVNRGFALARGDIYAWINADDCYLPGAFDTVSRAFAQLPDVQWLKGITDYINEASASVQAGQAHLYLQHWLSQGVYGRELHFVQQDSVFWRAGLWRQVGGFPDDLRLAGDYWLWTRCARRTPLYSLAARVSCFRRRPGQLSENSAAYQQEMATVQPNRSVRARLVRYALDNERFLPGRVFQFVLRLLSSDRTYYGVRLGCDDNAEMVSGDYLTVRTALTGKTR